MNYEYMRLTAEYGELDGLNEYAAAGWHVINVDNTSSFYVAYLLERQHSAIELRG